MDESGENPAKPSTKPSLDDMSEALEKLPHIEKFAHIAQPQ